MLVERSNDRLACVYESTAEKMNWKIIPVMEPDRPTWDPLPQILVKETIPNPTGYWIPIPEEDKEDS